MKAQISRDSFKEEKQYSAVYQQQGRMITDADWNEMVRILKHRMDRTVGASIASGSPREGGILSKNVIEWNWSSPKKLFKGAFKLKWGRIYVDGMYGEIRSSKPEATSEQSVKKFIKDQKDFPGNPADHLEQGSYYIAYIDLWERLVVALEEKHLRDEDKKHLLDDALHGADTCVRTQTMSQLKLAKLNATQHDDAVTEVIEQWERILADPEVPKHKKPLIPHGNATLFKLDSGSPVTTARAAHKNALFRLEVHESSLKNNQHTVVLKWSDENGAEQHDNEITSAFPDIPNFWEEKYIYECYSDETEKHMGQHMLEGVNGWNSEKAELYTYDGYKAKRGVAGSPAKQKPYVRRWDGYVTLKRMKAEKKWEVIESESSFGPHVKVDWNDNPSGNICQSLVLKNTEFRYKLELSTVKKRGREDVPDIFMVGDYWLVLLRDKGATLSAEVLSEEPVGIHHHYLVLGVYIGTYNPIRPMPILLTPKQWRRLSFPSLTNLTLDRVLVVDHQNGNEISIEDMLARRSSISKQGVVIFEGTLPPLAIVESDWIDPGLDTEPYIVIVGTEESDGSILIGSSFSDARVPRARVQIDPSTHHFRVRASNGETQSINLRVRWWALKTTDEAAVETHVAVALTVEPASITLVPKARKQFKAIVGGLPSTDVQWFVDDVANGDANRGLIDPQGNYTAPVVGSSTVFKIRARSTSSPSMEGTATVSVHVVTPQPGRLWGKVFDGTGLFPSPSSLPPDTSGLDGLYGAEIHLGSRYKTTNMDGDYSFDGQPAGTYELRVSKSNFKTHKEKVTISPNKHIMRDVILYDS